MSRCCFVLSFLSFVPKCSVSGRAFVGSCEWCDGVMHCNEVVYFVALSIPGFEEAKNTSRGANHFGAVMVGPLEALDKIAGKRGNIEASMLETRWNHSIALSLSIEHRAPEPTWDALNLSQPL